MLSLQYYFPVHSILSIRCPLAACIPTGISVLLRLPLLSTLFSGLLRISGLLAALLFLFPV